jgi:imidazolonepropionase-like amidohydrolase
VASGPPITISQGHCWHLGGEADTPDELRAAVRQRAERRVDVVKVMASGGALTAGTDVQSCQYSVEQLRLVVDEAHAAGLPVTAHAHALSAIERAIAAGVDGIEHCTCVTERGIELPDSVLDLLASSGIAVCPTLGKRPGVDPPPPVLALFEQLGITVEARLAVTGRMVGRGVRIVSGVDAGISAAKAHGVLSTAIADLVAAGASAATALASATSEAARACGIAERTGALRAGLDADVLVVDGDVRADVVALERVRAVFVSGAEVR